MPDRINSSAWLDFEKWWTGSESAGSLSNTRKYKHHSLITAAMDINNSSIGVIDILQMKYIYLSPNYGKFIGWQSDDYLERGVQWVFNKIHPDDVQAVLQFSELINKYFKDLPDEEKPLYRSYWDFRFRDEKGVYFRVLQQDCVLKYNRDGNMEELLFVATKIDNVVSSDSQHLKMTNGADSVFYKYDQSVQKMFLIDQLSKREIEIAKLISKSESLKQIAARLNISFNTVKVHSANMMRKLLVKDSIEMISLLRTWKFI
jgi:DNA-binding CsgD family transcriptional regulator